MVKCVALVGRLLWRAVKLARLCRFGCTLKILLYTQVPYPYHLLHSWLRHGGCDIIVNSQYLNGVAPWRRWAMMDVGRHVFYCMFCFVLIYPYITYTQFYASIKKRKKKFKKKYIWCEEIAAYSWLVTLDSIELRRRGGFGFEVFHFGDVWPFSSWGPRILEWGGRGLKGEKISTWIKKLFAFCGKGCFY